MGSPSWPLDGSVFGISLLHLLVCCTTMSQIAGGTNEVMRTRDGDNISCTLKMDGQWQHKASVQADYLSRGGEEAPPRRFPYMVSLKPTFGGDHTCGGVLIGPLHVLTAAHCERDIGRNPFVQIGGHFSHDNGSSDGAEVMRAAKWIPHPKWNGKFQDGYDIALVVLQKEAREAVPILLPDGESRIVPNTKVLGLGWGLNFKFSAPDKRWEQTSNTALQETTLKVVDSKRCPLKLKKHLQTRMVCVYDKSQCPCKGDSGGPLIAPDRNGWRNNSGWPGEDLLLGIASIGSGDCRLAECAALYTEVAGFRTWIDNAITKPKVDVAVALRLLWALSALVATVAMFMLFTCAGYFILQGPRGPKYHQALLKYAGVPGIPEYYVGRKDVEEILVQHLTKHTPRGLHPHVAVEGMGGIGKTTIACAVAGSSSLCECYKDCILWLHAGPQGDDENERIRWLGDVYARLDWILGTNVHRILGSGDVGGSPTQDSLIAAINHLFTRKKCLVIVDDLRSSCIWAVVTKFDCAVMVTTQFRHIVASDRRCRKVDIQALSVHESHRLICQASGSGTDCPLLQDLANMFGGHPLALTIGAALWKQTVSDSHPNERERELSRLLDGLRDPYRKSHISIPTEAMLHRESRDNHATISACLSMAIRRLPRSEEESYIVLSILPHGQCASVEMIRSLWNIQESDVLRRLQNLEALSLVHRDNSRCSAVGSCSWGLHDIQLDHLRALSKLDEHETLMEAAEQRQRAFLADIDNFQTIHNAVGKWRLLRFWREVASFGNISRAYRESAQRKWPNFGEGLTDCSGAEPNVHEMSHVHRCAMELMKLLPEGFPKFWQTLSALDHLHGGRHPSQSDLSTLFTLVQFLRFIAEYCTAGELVVRMLAWVKLNGNPHDFCVIKIVQELGCISHSEGQNKLAEGCLRMVLESAKKQLVENHPDIATSLNNLASVLRAQGNYEEAEALYREGLEMRKELFDDAHPDVAASLNHLALVLRNQGKYEEAVELHREGLEIREKVLGEVHPDVATSLSGLATVLANQGKYGVAEALYKRGLEMRKRVLGEVHPDVVASLTNLASVLSNQGKYDESESVCRDGLALGRGLGAVHPYVAGALNNLALVLNNKGKYEEAEKLYTEGLEMRQKLFGKVHPSIAASLNCLALVLRNQGRYDEAERLLKQGLEMRKEVFGEEHPHVAASLNDLASVLICQGKYEDAERLCWEGLKIRKQVLGETHPDVAASLNNLALIFSSKGRLADAERLHKEGLELKKKVVGDEHPDVATSLSHLASVLGRQGKYKEAEVLHKEGLRMRKKVLGEVHPDVAASLNDLALLYSDWGRYRDAEELHRKGLDMKRRVFGEVHPDVAISVNNLAWVLRNQGKYDEAERLHREALKMRRQVLGEVHPDIATSLNGLASVLNDLGKYEEAEVLHREGLDMKKQMLGEAHPKVAASLNNLALVLLHQGKFEEAEDLHRERLELKKKVLGEKHPTVATSLHNLALALSCQGKFKDAEKLHREALELRKEVLGRGHPDVSASLINVAWVLDRLGRCEEAQMLRREGMELKGVA
ncbi:unnamed protein product [Ostreobium quekettii]|uniref:Peptidase S1 domain-containing protein n=1 Tax=Ostreobium quekettii TaxID=121088 RepID=A0A8S1IXQ9_9CHLO|nr:unnamed protein product [Ostreobium quekettii]